MPTATAADVLAWRHHLILTRDADGYADHQDPEVVIAEMRAKATLTTTGRSIAATAIQILRIREGQIVLVRDFADSRVLGDVIREPPKPAASP
jgi:ketosteroid isomerase-like protein